ncbi:rhomboid family intramembrane serine protease [Salinactinospora qingdaonensis]|uniref:Rhomboid family intramembrane serine protease n=1 Tax=Salinactinospora qingdaonensis TaxID=702744 RepID=A0ABP7FEZ2_9ACTN
MTQSRIRGILTVIGLTAVMWILEFLDVLFGNALDTYGIQPRDINELGDIFLAPFLHFGFQHLIANTLPLLVLGALVAFSGLGRFAAASLIIIIVSGLGVWFISPASSTTLGASGLVFGYFGYLVLRGFVERKTSDIVIMICVLIFYGTMIFGVLPANEGVSWQAHLFGFLGGLLAAYLLPKRQRPAPLTGGYGASGSYGGYGGY